MSTAWWGGQSVQIMQALAAGQSDKPPAASGQPESPGRSRSGEIGCGSRAFGHRQEAGPPTSTPARSLVDKRVADFESALGRGDVTPIAGSQNPKIG